MEIIDKELQAIKTQILDFACESDELKQILHSFLSNKSKFIRSISAILFYKASGQVELSDEQYKILVATEIIHNASLIHDDVIDGSTLRRGVKSLNIDFDNKLSIIAGDYLISIAINELLTLNNPQVITLYTDTISRMCIGESLQYFSKGQIPTLEEYLKKTQYKTAELFNVCFKSMNLYCSSSYIGDFGLDFGMAFQIKNDLDDYNQKENSEDIKDGIYNAPVIYSNSFEFNNNAIVKTQNLLHNYYSKMINNIRDFKDSEYKKSLIELVERICN